ncbi:MAG: tetratricopeptide repeat protein [Gemmatimonadaceae bacterium]
MNALSNDAHVDADVVHRYVAGTLARDETASFERHLLVCLACQQAVRDGAAIRSGLRVSPAQLASRRRRSLTRWMPWLLPAAAAAALVLVVATRDEPVRRLGRLDTAPVFQPLPVRSSTSENDRRVDSAMTAYRAGDFARARALLSDVASRQPSPAIHFYLGVSALVMGDAKGAIEPLRAASEPGQAYSDDAHYYLAKALLRVGSADSAVAHLRAVRSEVRLAVRARALLDSVTAARSR